MAIIKECIENLEPKFKELQCPFCRVEVGATNMLTKIEEIINRLFEAMLFNRASEASNNPKFILSKNHSRSVEKEMRDNFEGERPML